MWFDKETREALKADGVCIYCGQRPAREGMVGCAGCAAYHRDYLAKYITERRARGHCWNCNTPAVEGRTRCIRHLIEHRERSRDRRARLKRVA
jgi:hypothetical protein